MSFSELKLGELASCRNEMNAQNLFLNDEFGHFKELSAKLMMNKVN
jgi:hypothetical protein